MALLVVDALKRESRVSRMSLFIFPTHRITTLLQIIHFGPTSTMYFTNPAEWAAHISNHCCNLLEVRTLLDNNINLPISNALHTRA